MNDDDKVSDLDSLRAQHRALDERIELLGSEGPLDQIEVARLKKQKLRLKDQIELIRDRTVPDLIA